MNRTSLPHVIYTFICMLLATLLVTTSIEAKTKHHKETKVSKVHRSTKQATKKKHSALKLVFGPKLFHYSSLVMEYPSRKIISSENPTLQNQPASLTKVMTLYLTFRALDNGTIKLTQPLYISEHAASRQPSKLGLRAGDTITVEEAICGLVTKSANDAASVLAEALGGTEDQFAVLMTDQAHKLGMANTTFKNASGIGDSQQLTTAQDMAVMGASVLHDFPHYYHFFALRQFTYHNIVFRTHNHLLGKYEGCDGIKTGYTAASGFNLLSSATREGRRLIAVVLGGDSIRSRDLRTMQILDAGFAQLQNPNAVPATSPLPVQEVPKTNAPQTAPTKTAENECNYEVELELPNTTLEAAY